MFVAFRFEYRVIVVFLVDVVTAVDDIFINAREGRSCAMSLLLPALLLMLILLLLLM